MGKKRSNIKFSAAILLLVIRQHSNSQGKRKKKQNRIITSTLTFQLPCLVVSSIIKLTHKLNFYALNHQFTTFLFISFTKDPSEQNEKKKNPKKNINLHSLCQKEKAQQKKFPSTAEAETPIARKPNYYAPYCTISFLNCVSLTQPLRNAQSHHN